MQGKEYQYLANRTNDRKSTDRLIAKANLRINEAGVFKVDGTDLGGVLNACLGLAGEAGETLDMVKKWVFHEKELDVEHLKKELGDVMWYMALMCESFGFDLDEILQMNVDKLRSRYPEGFDVDKSVNRSE